MSDDDVAAWLHEKASAMMKTGGDMGTMEKALDGVSAEPRRRALERLAQEAADRQARVCPRCKGSLNVEAHQRVRSVNTTFGKIRVMRGYGFCPECGDYCFPADAMLGLHDRATASPRVQEICALTALRAPAGQAEVDVRRLTGLHISASCLHREARRQGERALALRDADEELTQTPEGVAKLAARASTPQTPFTLVIEIDAWNIRERDNWGRTDALLKAGEDTGRWHWVYTGTVFRLDQRGTTESGRPVIAERGYVATRRGLDTFQRQLYAEALQRGLLNADLVLIVADGAVWIWNLASDRFKNAKQRVDLHHVQQHLWNLANDLHGQGTVKAKEWVSPFLLWLERRKDGALDVIHGLQEMRETLEDLTRAQRKAINREVEYFEEHKLRMDYKTGKALGQPVGSGAIESTCSQYQRRFKLTGQFWSLAGDEAFLALATLHRNARWRQLFPHDST
jgi:ribosomal protein S27AE